MVKVDEPDDDTACLMLRGLKSRYAEHHGVHITDEAVKAAVTLSRRYLTGRQLPDKAVDLLDTASARVRMSLDTIPEPLTRMKAQLTAPLWRNRRCWRISRWVIPPTANVWPPSERKKSPSFCSSTNRKPGTAGAGADGRTACLPHGYLPSGEIADLQMQLTAVQQNTPLLGLDVDARTVATVIADWTGVPLSP